MDVGPTIFVIVGVGNLAETLLHMITLTKSNKTETGAPDMYGYDL